MLLITEQSISQKEIGESSNIRCLYSIYSFPGTVVSALLGEEHVWHMVRTDVFYCYFLIFPMILGSFDLLSESMGTIMQSIQLFLYEQIIM